jgi:hypothetical protein
MTTAAAADLKSLAVEVTKGNELMSFVTEDFQAGMFQSAMADGMDANKAIRLGRTVAALGSRGDYIDMKMFCTVGAVGALPAVKTIYVEMVDYTGVPTSVQHTVFGKYSPFVTPKEPMNESMMDGIDRQELAIVNTEQIASQAALTTAIAQLVRGSSDSRIDFAGDDLDFEDCTYLRLRMKPNSDGVILLRAGAKIWAEPDENALDDGVA